ncbi:hypothetical protein [Henriciella litoralis]|uniref:hypothetical protein n=1 Tax=Henriciella litoralis TaxID=568102 RepID=UPI000A020C6E|nr:hypothetical protein [Henriciella litoralis]
MTGPTLNTRISSAWTQIAALVASLAHLAGCAEGRFLPRIAPAVRIKALRLLRPAEALARRLIVTMARGLIDQARAALRPNPKEASGPARSHTSTRPAFKLFEPMASFSSILGTGHFPAARTGPGPRILDLSAPYPGPPAAPQPVARPPSLAARIDALARLCADPARLALRHARKIAAHDFRSLRLRRINPLRPGLPQGRYSRHTPDWLKDALSLFGAELRAGPSLYMPP